MADSIVIGLGTAPGPIVADNNARIAARLAGSRPFTVMGTAPTITLGVADAAPVIASSSLLGFNNAAFRYSAGQYAAAGASYPDTIVAKNVAPFTGASGQGYGVNVEWTTDAPDFEIYSKGLSGAATLEVDDQAVSATFFVDPGTGSLYYRRVTFTTRKERRFRLIGDPSYRFGGVSLPTADKIEPATWVLGPRIAVFGSSIVEGSGSDSRHTIDSMFNEIGRLARCELLICGSGGTGFLSTGAGGGRVTYRTRVVNNLQWFNPQAIVVEGSFNDQPGNTPAAIQAEVTLFINTVRANFSCPLVMFGCYNPNNTLAGTVQTADDAVRAACVAAGVPFRSFCRTFNTDNNLAGSQIGTDATHPTSAGQRLAGGIQMPFVLRALQGVL